MALDCKIWQLSDRPVFIGHWEIFNENARWQTVIDSSSSTKTLIGVHEFTRPTANRLVFFATHLPIIYCSFATLKSSMIRLKGAWREDLNWIWISADFQQSRNQTLERGEFAPVNCLLLCQLAEEKLLQFKTQILSKILSWNLERSTVLRSPLFSYFYPFLSFPLSLLNLPKIRRKMLSKRSKADRCFHLE